MISYDEAQDILKRNFTKAATETIDIKQCNGRVLAMDVISDINMPPFDKSAMDGFAIRREDLFNELTVIETIKAGDIPQKRIQKNECSKIMTGAIVPEGADCVIIVEKIEFLSEDKIRYTGRDTNTNIAYKAEDIKKGETVLKKDTYIRSQEMAILATVGCTSPLVYKLPRMAIMTTGNEIVEPYKYPENGLIRNSNAYQLIAQIQNCGIQPDYLGIVEDTEDVLYERVCKSIEAYDIIILTGGISMGDYDFVPDVMEKAGVELMFRSISIKPGKPTIFGKKNNTFVFCLPGNPVSSFTIFELFVKPFVHAFCGRENNIKELNLPLKEKYTQKPTDRLSWLPVFIDNDLNVSTVNYHGSAHIYSLCFANGLMRIEPFIKEIDQGEKVNVRQI